MTERSQTAATVVMVACALLVTGFVARRELTRPRAPVIRESVTTQRDWQEYAQSDRQIGPSDAPVTIVEFSDFQCPFCRTFVSFRDSLASLGIPVRIVYRHLPSPIHANALHAAQASECAALQGRFQEMHDALFEDQQAIGSATWWSYAATAGVPDSLAFDKCLRSNTAWDQIAADTLAARQLKIRGTPTLLIQDIRVDGLPTFDSLRSYIERAAK